MKRTVVLGLTLAVVAAWLGCNALNNPPNTPLTPSGPDSGHVNLTHAFSTSATDPDGDRVQYRFDWGDGFGSPWSDLVASGTQVEITGSWWLPGNYEVKAQAKDEHGATSSWSGGHQVTIFSGGVPGTQ